MIRSLKLKEASFLEKRLLNHPEIDLSASSTLPDSPCKPRKIGASYLPCRRPDVPGPVSKEAPRLIKLGIAPSKAPQSDNAVSRQIVLAAARWLAFPVGREPVGRLAGYGPAAPTGFHKD